jgi:uncharacterized protein YggE
MNVAYAVVGVLLLTSSGPLQAERVAIDAALQASDKSFVEASGNAVISAKPDQVVIEIGVVTQGSTAASVAAQNAKQTDAVLADLRKILAPTDQLKSTSYSVRPNFQAPKPGATATIGGYTATNIVEARLDDLAQAGKVIDAVLQSGANNIQKLQFGLKNPHAARTQALREAAVQAKANAEAIAAGLGVHVVRVLSAEESELPNNFAMQKSAPAPGTVEATQLEPGSVEVSATVTLKVEVAP